MGAPTPEVVRERVPYRLTGVLMVVVGLGSFACFFSALAGHWPGLTRLELAGGGLLLFGINYLLKQTLGYDVEVTAAGIRQLKAGGVEIRWEERPEVKLEELTDPFPQLWSLKTLAARGMIRLAHSQTAVVSTPDGRRIRLDTVFGRPVHDAIRRFSGH